MYSSTVVFVIYDTHITSYITIWMEYSLNVHLKTLIEVCGAHWNQMEFGVKLETIIKVWGANESFALKVLI